MRLRYHLRRAGFTLLELSIVLVIVGVVIGGAMMAFNQSVERRQAQETQSRLQTIERALRNYQEAYNRLPCPANIQLAMDTADFGKESSSDDTVATGDAPAFDAEDSGTYDCVGPTNVLLSSAAAYLSAPQVYLGGVPTKTLNLPDDMAVDGWGRRIAYVVDNNFTAANAFTNIGVDNTTARIAIKETAGGSTKTDTAIYTLLSYGPNGHGAYPRKGASTRISNNTGGADELENCNCTAASPPAVGTVNATFVQKPATIDAYDDIVRYSTRADFTYFPQASYVSGGLAVLLQNGDFEDVDIANNSISANPSGAGWVFTGTSGVVDGDGGIGGRGSNGEQAGYVGANGMIAQTLALSAGLYTLRFDVNTVSGAADQALEILLDGVQVGSDITVTDETSYTTKQVSLTVVSSGNHTIAFRGDSGNSSYIFIDNISIIQGLAALPPVGGGGAVTPPDVTSGIVAWWKFEDGGGTSAEDSADDYGATPHNGLIVNTATWVPGPIGLALDFVTSNRLHILTTFNPTLNDFTVCTWFYPRNGAGGQYQRLVDKNYAAGFWLGMDGGAPQKWGGGIMQTLPPFGTFLDNSLADNQWHHICSSRAGTLQTVTANGGAEIKTGTVSSAALSPDNVIIGTATFGSSDDFYGQMDDVRIYNRALTAQEISDIYQQGSPPAPPPPPPTPAATFIATDTTTQGNWVGVYGSEGYWISQYDASKTNPSYVTPTTDGWGHTWVAAGGTSNALAPYYSSAATGRIASCWYQTEFYINLPFNDSDEHYFSIYFLDWDQGGNRQGTVEVYDGDNNLLDTRPLTGLEVGKYLTWSVKGNIKFKIISTSSHVTVAGMFFDPVP